MVFREEDTWGLGTMRSEHNGSNRAGTGYIDKMIKLKNIMLEHFRTTLAAL